MKNKTLFATLLLAFVAFQVTAQKKFTNPVYGSDFPDPTVQRALDGTFYAYATGCKCKKSTDLVNWTNVSGVISRPTWNDSIHADGTKDSYSLWAADVNYVDGKYICYYASALWGNGSRTGIGVAVGDSPTKFTDHGKLFRSTEIGVKNSIDPCYVEEFDKKYLVWGSFNDICIVELTDDALSVKNFSPINNPQPNGSWTRHAGVTKIAGGAFEGAMIYKRGKYYYLFASVGSCCEGENSTYRTVVGRSTSLMGPYKNKDGGDMKNNQYTTIISGNDRWKGPGHNSEIITDDEGQDWLLYHSYDRNNNFNGRLMLLDKITWRSDWPVINPGVSSVQGHPSSNEMDAPVFYTGNGANVTYKLVNADLSKSQWKGWDVVASEDCTNSTGNGTAFAPFGLVQNGGTFDISQTVTASVSDGLYEMKVNGFDTEHSVEYYVGKVATPVLCPADNGTTTPTNPTTISNNFITGKFSQSVYGLVTGGSLTFGMRSKQALSSTERFVVGKVNVIYRDKNANADSTTLASVLDSYYAMAEDVASSGKPYYNNYNGTIAHYKELAEGSDTNTRYQQLLKIHKTLDSIQTSIDVYATLAVAVQTLQDNLVTAEAGGYSTQEAKDALAEGQQVLAEGSLKDKEVKALVLRMQNATHNMMYSYQTGDGTQENPYVIVRPEQLDHMHDVLISEQMVYFVLDADIDMEGYEWVQLNSSDNSYRYWINFDGRGHIIRNLTPAGNKYYPSFFGTMCGEIRNTGFVDAKVDGVVSGAAVIGGALGHSTFKDAEGNLDPVIIENCYVTGSVTSKGYVGAIGGTLGNSPIFIRNCYSAASVTGNGSSANYSGGLVGRVRTNLTMENCYAAAPVSSPVAGGVVAGGQNSSTPSCTYTNVIAWNPSVDGATALPFGATTELDILSHVYTFADMLVNEEAMDGTGLGHMELCEKAAEWGAPWYHDATAGNGYPILQWQYKRGDYRDICGFDPDNDPTSIKSIENGQWSMDNGRAVIYNLSGQRMQKMQRGINIVGGKKIIVK